MIITGNSEHFSSPHLKSTPIKIDWPGNEIILPTADGTRLFLPEIVYQSSYAFDVIKRTLLEQPSSDPHDQYVITLIDAVSFPYTNGNLNFYFYKGSTPTTKMLDLSAIIQFSHRENGSVFWLVSTANKDFNSRGCNLYSNLPVRDLSTSEDFAWQMEKILISIQAEQTNEVI